MILLALLAYRYISNLTAPLSVEDLNLDPTQLNAGGKNPDEL